ncbi:hypothetical protein ACH4CE_25920 [Streptomyces gelaticus]|uniref:hypothetical protein n=1 Tax=Streptomyces gelaticus TaxID=285446 RepID=UPI0037971E0D
MTSSADEPAPWTRFRWGSPRVPHASLDEETRRNAELPGTMLPVPQGMNHGFVFEP